MDYRDYLAQLTADSAALGTAVAQADLQADVPSCPGWSVDDLAHHVAEVYQHKITAMRTGDRPDPWPPDPREGAWLTPSSEFLAASTDELLHELSTRDPSERCWTWYAENQSVGFWARRMAQETVIHRWDAERTIGEPAPIDARVAADGIDEFLVAFLSGDWSDDPQPAPYGSIAVFGSVDRWLVDLSADTVTVQRHAGTAVLEADSNAQISGTDEELLLALWGRRPLPAAGGDQSLVDELRSRLALVRQ